MGTTVVSAPVEAWPRTEDEFQEPGLSHYGASLVVKAKQHQRRLLGASGLEATGLRTERSSSTTPLLAQQPLALGALLQAVSGLLTGTGRVLVGIVTSKELMSIKEQHCGAQEGPRAKQCCSWVRRSAESSPCRGKCLGHTNNTFPTAH